MSGQNSQARLETLLELTEAAFSGDPHQSLLANLHKLRDGDWAALPPGGGRSVGSILEHVGWAKWMYADYAFGDGTLRGDIPPMVPADGRPARPQSELLEWLHEGHRRWVGGIRSLADDRELERHRPTNWGKRLPAKTLIQMLIAHDTYHAGEINHLRALLQDDDRWRY